MESGIQSKDVDKPMGNLDLFEDMFESWREQESNLEQDAKSLSQKIESYEVQQNISNAKIMDLNKTVELLQASITALHNELGTVEQLEKENFDLKSKLNASNSQLKTLKEEDRQRKSEFNMQLTNLEKEHSSKLKNIEVAHSEEMAKLTSKLDEVIMQKDKEISELRIKYEELEKDKQSELIRMSVDYENKLAKIQRQKAASSLNQQQSSSNQEIFRKKLQHLKSDYDREISNLKEQITSLQSQLVSASESQGRSLFSVAPLSKKIRKQ